jgi:DNA repair protein RadA/Sms
MLEKGLAEVENPSMMLISGRPENTSGSCIACVMEGSRPILAEVQGLVAPTGFGNPRRMANGFDYNRMAMLLAVVEKRAGYFVGNMDCYVNIIGGLKIDEPASDLSVALSVISSLKDTVIRNDVIAFGEIGLGGEIRSVTCAEQRVNEAKRLGFKRCVIPYHNLKKLSPGSKKGIEVIGVNNIRQAFEAVTE